MVAGAEEGGVVADNASMDEAAALDLLAKATAEANAAFGTIVSLMLTREEHQQLFLQDLKWLVVPALLHRQFRIFRIKGVPVGYLLWAHVTEEVEQRLLSPTPKLRPDEWDAGDRTWVIDFHCPPGDREKLKVAVMESFGDRDVWVRGNGEKLPLSALF